MAAISLPKGLFDGVKRYLPEPLRCDDRTRRLLAAIFYVVWGNGDWKSISQKRFGCCGEDAFRLYRMLSDLGTWSRIERVVLNEMSRGRFRRWAAA